MYNRIMRRLGRRFLAVRPPYYLIGLSILLYTGNVLTFYPGYMSNDSIGQLGQVLGAYPVADLTPPILTLVWKMFLCITGLVSSMLLFQLALLWVALCLLSLYVWYEMKSFKLALVPLVIGLLPFVANISGVIWKDNQMVFSLLLACSIGVGLKYVSAEYVRMAGLLLSMLLLMYAALVRYNALPAVVPLILFVITASNIIGKLRWRLIATVIVLLVIVGLVPVVNQIMHVQNAHPVSAVMLDDILNINSRQSISDAHIPKELQRNIMRMQTCAESRSVVINNFWICANDLERQSVQHTDYGALQGFWLASVLRHPVGYALYRVQTFFLFLFPPLGQSFIWQDGIVPNSFGQGVAFKRLGAILKIYVINFGYKHLLSLYEPWFWGALSVAMAIYAKRLRRYGAACLAVSLSSILYILSYFPTGATIDYRYIYWPVLAMLLVVLLTALDRLTLNRS